MGRYRGGGSSQRGDIKFSQDIIEDDFEAVIEAAGLDRFALWLSTTGGPVLLGYAGKHPERVTAIIAYSTFARQRMHSLKRPSPAFPNWQEATGNWLPNCSEI